MSLPSSKTGTWEMPCIFIVPMTSLTVASGETLISSSNIRSFVAKGDVELAARLLGQPYFIDGTVIQGAGRGASLGIRTANLKTENELIPLGGVYACYAEVGKKRPS